MRSPTLRLATVLLLLAAAGILGALTVLLFVADPRYSIYTMVGDDAGYYLAIARNFCLGHGLSFDRLHETNGFNPLLTALLIVADRLFVRDLSLVGCYRAGILVTWLANMGSLGLLVRLVNRFLDPAVFAGELRRLAIAASVAFFVGFVALKSNYGMDAPLVMVLGLLYLERVQRGGLLAPGLRAGAADGALLALMFLARVDTLPFLVAAFALMALRAPRERAPLASLVVRASTCAALVAPYLLWSTRHFGTWMPVSARLKSSFPALDPAASLRTVLHSSLNPADLAFFALALGIALFTGLRVLRDGRSRNPAEALGDGRTVVVTLLTLYLLMRFAFMGLFSRMDVQGSYVILAHVYNLLMALTLAGALAERSGAHGPRTAARVVALACLGLALTTVVLLAGKGRSLAATWRSETPGGGGDEFALARAIHERTGAGDVIYGGAFGLIGFFADRPWINGDGVANTYDYQRVLEGGSLPDYLAANRVTHIVFERGGRQASGAGPRMLTVRSVVNGRVNPYAMDGGESLVAQWSPRGGGITVCLARYRPIEP
jgi:hypothetical protein